MITSIAHDHTRQLGSTLGAIATEKAGILKRFRPAVSGVCGEEPRRAIRRVAAQRRCPLREMGIDFTFETLPPQQPLVRPTPCRASVQTWRTTWGTLGLSLLGPHQAHNAAVALAGLDLLAEVDPALEVSHDAVVRGLASLRWPARVEVLGESPWVVVDGAHNVASANALAETLRTSFPVTPRTLVFGTSRDKDLTGQLRSLLPLFDTLIATRYVGNPRSVPPEDIATAIQALGGRPARITYEPAEALDLAWRLTDTEALVCVTGSLFLAAEARAILLGQKAVSRGNRCRNLMPSELAGPPDHATIADPGPGCRGVTTMRDGFWVQVGAVWGFLAVAMGAFGAHGLKDRLAELGTGPNFHTAAQYHMYCALALLAVGLLVLTGRSGIPVCVAGWALLFGSLIFSGSLYILALTGLRWLGAITPFGGVAMLVGWAALAVAAGTRTTR